MSRPNPLTPFPAREGGTEALPERLASFPARKGFPPLVEPAPGNWGEGPRERSGVS